MPFAGYVCGVYSVFAFAGCKGLLFTYKLDVCSQLYANAQSVRFILLLHPLTIFYYTVHPNDAWRRCFHCRDFSFLLLVTQQTVGNSVNQRHHGRL
jgi:hypothetical protein